MRDCREIHWLVVVLALAFGLPAGAKAGVDEALSSHVLPGFGTFARSSAALAAKAGEDCRAGALKPAYHAAYDAWMGVSHLHLGPLEQGGRALAIAFWPDTRGMVGRTVARLVADEDPVVDTGEGFASVSVAGRGLLALERLIYEPEFAGYGAGDYECRLVGAIAVDLARMGREMADEWPDFAALLRRAGAPGNDVFLKPGEASQALYTALMSGLEFNRDQRLGRVMGSFDRPRPNRAEARRSGRSLRNVVLSLKALRDLARGLADGPIEGSEAAFAQALETAGALDDPVLAGVATPQGRLKVEVLAQEIRRIEDAVAQEIGAALGVSAGFNSQDGD
ncbi:MAG: imelysin family protein [Pseudomonadota bacterium]|uniref:imelysin family protein n=1 Tax=Roseovarius TaxID=74030 RepID=UPI0022A72821|nr:imelysin family protein [Roseovarius sp. EGI FJ00037]MCZ0811680.1 imelysin family protein [Roseovarius sp. EGI FJ00037]